MTKTMQHLNVSFQPAMIEVPLVPLFQNEYLSKSFHLKMSVICTKMNVKETRPYKVSHEDSF